MELLDKERCNWKVIAETNWNIYDPRSVESIQAGLLKGIYEELKTLNRLLGCQNFTDIPHKLDAIRFNTKKPVKKASKRKGK